MASLTRLKHTRHNSGRLGDITISFPGTNPPDEINVVVEIPKGSSIMYVIHAASVKLIVDRILFPPMSYTRNYGFVPRIITVVLTKIDPTNSPTLDINDISDDEQ